VTLELCVIVTCIVLSESSQLVAMMLSSLLNQRCIIIAALCNRAGHYIFGLWFLFLSFYLSIFFCSLPNLSC